MKCRRENAIQLGHASEVLVLERTGKNLEGILLFWTHSRTSNEVDGDCKKGNAGRSNLD